MMKVKMRLKRLTSHLLLVLNQKHGTRHFTGVEPTQLSDFHLIAFKRGRIYIDHPCLIIAFISKLQTRAGSSISSEMPFLNARTHGCLVSPQITSHHRSVLLFAQMPCFPCRSEFIVGTLSFHRGICFVAKVNVAR